MKKYISLFTLAIIVVSVHSQSPIKEYFDKKGIEGISKQIVIGGEPITANGYDDGHGRNPYLTSKNQVPDTLALITFYIYDVGVEYKSGNTIYSYSLSEKGGNYLANNIHKSAIEKIKESYKKIGIVVLTPEEYLNTPEKIKEYNNFKPALSKLGNFLSGLESNSANVAVAADFYRGFDINASADHERMESLGYELANKLGVDGVLSIAIELASNKKEVSITGFKMAMHAPNPIPKKDKKYISQNMGAGYYAGQLFAFGTFYFKSPMLIAEIKKGAIINENYLGIDDILACFAGKFDQIISKAIDKNSK